MKKILIVEDSSVIIIGILYILKDIGFDQSVMDVVNSFDDMTTMIDNYGYELVFFGLKTDQNKQLKSLLEFVQKHSRINFLVFSEMVEIHIQKKMYRAGIKGILDKMSSKKEISFAIQRVLDNEIYMNTSSYIKLVFFGEENKKVYPVLTFREKQIAELLLQGKKNVQICDTLKIKPSTVCTFKTKIFNKLKIKNIVELKDWEKNY